MNPYSQAFKDHVRVYGLDNNLVLRMINTCDELKSEVARLRSALQLMVESYNALEHRYRYGSEEHGALIEEFDNAVTIAAATLDEVK